MKTFFKLRIYNSTKTLDKTKSKSLYSGSYFVKIGKITFLKCIFCDTVYSGLDYMEDTCVKKHQDLTNWLLYLNFDLRQNLS